MSMITFSRRRVAAVVILTLITAWYLGAMHRNVTPHGADLRRWETPQTLPIDR